MRHLKYMILIGLFIAQTSMLKAQFKLSVDGGMAFPGKDLSQINFPKTGAGWAAALHYSFFSQKKLRLDAGIAFNYIVCGDEEYRFGDDKKHLYNLALTANADARLVLNTNIIKPYISLGYGALGTSANEKFYDSKTASTTISKVITNITTWNSTAAVGLLLELADDVELDINITHFNGGKNRFVDFTSVTTDNNHVYITPQTAAVFDLYFLQLGFLFTMHRDYNGSSSIKSGNAIRSECGGRINRGSSSRHLGPKR